MPEVLYIKLREINCQEVGLWYSYEEEFQNDPLKRSLNSIDQLIQNTDANYDTDTPGRPERLGKTLYRWLNGENDRFLEQTIKKIRQKIRSQYLGLF